MPDIALESVTPTAAAATDNIVVRRGAGPADHTIALVSLASVGPTNLTWTAATSTVASDTGADATLTAADGTNPGLMTSAQFTKLAGVATGATANSADATLLARANHTGTQLASTISDFATAADARIAAASINALADVVITTPTTGQVVKYNGTNWINDTDATGGGVTDGDKGDITVSGTGAVWTIDAGVVTLAKQADMATASVVYRKTAAAGPPEVQTLATLKTDLGLTGTNSGDQTITLTGDVTGTGTGSFAATIAADAVTNAKLANVATSTIKGRVTAATGDPEDLTATQVRTLIDSPQLSAAQNFTAAQGVTPVALTDAVNIATNAALGNIFTVTLGGNRTLDNPTNVVAGRTYAWVLTQDATGSRTLAYGTAFDFPGGTAPVLTTTASAIDLITGIAISTTRILCVVNKAFS